MRSSPTDMSGKPVSGSHAGVLAMVISGSRVRAAEASFELAEVDGVEVRGFCPDELAAIVGLAAFLWGGVWMIGLLLVSPGLGMLAFALWDVFGRRKRWVVAQLRGGRREVLGTAYGMDAAERLAQQLRDDLFGAKAAPPSAPGLP